MTQTSTNIQNLIDTAINDGNPVRLHTSGTTYITPDQKLMYLDANGCMRVSNGWGEDGARYLGPNERILMPIDIGDMEALSELPEGAEIVLAETHGCSVSTSREGVFQGMAGGDIEAICLSSGDEAATAVELADFNSAYVVLARGPAAE